VSLFDYSNNWPAALYVNSNDSVPIHSCPSRMHQVIWGQNDTFLVRLFPKTLSRKLNPEFEVDSESIHHTVYRKLAFSDDNVAEKNQPSGQYLFIPENYLSSMGALTDRTVSCLRMCFVDASNLRAFRTEISMEAKISDYAQDVLTFLNSADADLKMNRVPKDFILRKVSPSTEIMGISKVLTQDVSLGIDAESGSRSKKSSEKFKGKLVL
jgi:hypothetical protein